MQWLRESLPKVPREYRVSMCYIALSGLRPSEACESATLVHNLSAQGRLAEYYDKELCLLSHFSYPKIFLRNTKNAFISFISPALIKVVSDSRPLSYMAVQCALWKYNCEPIQTKGLRKYYATLVKSKLDNDMTDLMQGRLDPRVLLRHYVRPILAELRDKVLTAIKPLEEELLALV